MAPLSGQQVLVLGLGESGLAMARWCARCGARVAVWDSRDAPPQLDALREQVPAAELRGGALGAQWLAGVQLLLKSPGLGPHDPRIVPALQAARATGVPVAGEIELFMQALAVLRAERDYAPQVLAVTGTNGKTTTTALTALLVERAGRSVVAAGNIGPTMLDTLSQRLDEGALPQVWVLELSSFQLDCVLGFEPSAAAVLNLTQDHLDWHGDMAAYAAAKAHIFGERTIAVINRDDPLVEAMLAAPAPAVPAKGRARAAKGRARAAKPIKRTVVRFGLQAPTAPGDYGIVTDNGIAWLVRALPDETEARRRKDDELPPEIHLQRLMPADALRLRGRHNAANALAALALATAIGCPLAPMLHGLREYGGEPHRVQPVGRVGDVEAFDDSKGTNVGATVAALVGLGDDKAPAKLVVILGGDGKGQDFAPLAEPVARHARAVALIGRDAPAIEQALAVTGVPTQRHADLPTAVRWCFEQARGGDAVLLSPACASLDMFRNYGHRAEVFVQAVHELAAERGEISA
ncbi:MAG TPA: UDP-N-acetylmuramoyl-L-alanine--D-glutamate ligase [Burkholderiaceae bacterium]|nr:UDP-N-acetylmuramoyl-L-alanine--D-glutamate ligase [Burkholderiaceae bacterium]